MNHNRTVQQIAHLKNTLANLDKMQAVGELQLVLDVSTCASMKNASRIEISGMVTPTTPLFNLLREAVKNSLAFNQKNAAKEIEELTKALS
jgi:hypothetical protein